MKLFKRTLLVCLLAYLVAMAFRIYVRKYYIWLPGWARWALTSRAATGSPIHLFFLYVDHFEPGDRTDLLRQWDRRYRPLADRHKDGEGRIVQHTWFYHAERPVDGNMEMLKSLVEGGYGEVELHYHHGNDTAASVRNKYETAIRYLQRFGFSRTVDGQTRFAFVHGNWALDNSNGPRHCGVNLELKVLREIGCFADFTFPAIWHPAQPPYVNRISVATDDERPKSYARAVPLRVGEPVTGDLVIFQGPLTLALSPNLRRLFVQVEDSNIHPGIPLSPSRVDLWVRTGIHVEGKPDWVFIKVHGHSIGSPGDMEETLGAGMDRALSYVESRYNDGARYRLHYVTAREAYNLARAAAAGNTGDPRRYYDWAVKPYVAGSARR